MGKYDDVVEINRRTMVLFFVVDTSGSMSGSKIGTVNTAIEEIVPEIKEISETNSDSKIKVATLVFSTGAHWVDSTPVSAENYRWNFLDANGVTDLGAACIELNEKLSRKAFMTDVTGSFAPAIFLLSDGRPTDNYKYGLEKLRENNWFKKAIKVAIAIGDDADQSVLADFTGTSEAVITVHTPEALKKWIHFVSVRASEIGSKSSNVKTETLNTTPMGDQSEPQTNVDDEENGLQIESKQEEFVKEIQNQITDIDDSSLDDGIVW